MLALLHLDDSSLEKLNLVTGGYYTVVITLC